MNKKRILVVDDRTNWLTTIKIMLEDEYELLLCTNPLQAKKAFDEAGYDLVILDKNLPEEWAGLELLKYFREIKSTLPAVILTDYDNVASAVESMKLGAADYVPKKTDNLKKVLKAKIKELLAASVSNEFVSLINQGESDILEYKSSLRWDIKVNKLNKDLEKVIVKTIAAFMNSENESNLLIGVDDDGNILGLQRDYSTLGKKQNRDSFESLLITLILDACGKDCIPLIKVKFYQFDGNDVCQVSVKPSPKPVFVKDDKAEHFFVRTGNSTRLLTTREAMEYCKIRWSDHFPYHSL